MISEHKVVALLPMKAHSERVKGKNFRAFAGRPLFAWVLDTLLGLDFVDQIVINTDARAILSDLGIERAGRVLIRDRREELCGDLVSMNRVIEDDIRNVPAECYLMTHTTNPLLSGRTLENALKAYRAGLARGHDSLFSVNKMQTRFYRQDGSAINHDPARLMRTQDLEPWYEENSNLYIFSRTSFQKTGARIGERPVLFETPRLESIDIDDIVGWTTAELIALCGQIGKVYPRE